MLLFLAFPFAFSGDGDVQSRNHGSVRRQNETADKPGVIVRVVERILADGPVDKTLSCVSDLTVNFVLVNLVCLNGAGDMSRFMNERIGAEIGAVQFNVLEPLWAENNIFPSS